MDEQLKKELKERIKEKDELIDWFEKNQWKKEEYRTTLKELKETREIILKQLKKIIFST